MSRGFSGTQDKPQREGVKSKQTKQGLGGMIPETEETENKNIEFISSEIWEDIPSIKQKLDTMINKSELWKVKKMIPQIK